MYLKLSFDNMIRLYYDLQTSATLHQMARKYKVSQPTVSKYKKDWKNGLLTLKTITERYKKHHYEDKVLTQKPPLKFGELRKPEIKKARNEETKKARNEETRLSPNYGKGKVNNLPRKVEHRILELVQHGKRSFEIVSLINLEFDHVALSRSDLHPYLLKRA
jgi:hypothetical protein